MEEEDEIDDADLLDDGIVCGSLEFDIDTEEDDEDYATRRMTVSVMTPAPVEFKKAADCEDLLWNYFNELIVQHDFIKNRERRDKANTASPYTAFIEMLTESWFFLLAAFSNLAINRLLVHEFNNSSIISFQSI